MFLPALHLTFAANRTTLAATLLCFALLVFNKVLQVLDNIFLKIPPSHVTLGADCPLYYLCILTESQKPKLTIETQITEQCLNLAIVCKHCRKKRKQLGRGGGLVEAETSLHIFL